MPWDKYDTATAFAVLKHFLANLPYPLLTNQLLDCFLLSIGYILNNLQKQKFFLIK